MGTVQNLNIQGSIHPGIIETISAGKLALVLLIVLIIFGPARLPQLGRQLGAGMREFKNSITGRNKEHEDEDASVGNEQFHVTKAELPTAEPVAAASAATSQSTTSE